MRIETRYEKRVVNVAHEVYISEDGKEFADEISCRTYEDTVLHGNGYDPHLDSDVEYVHGAMDHVPYNDYYDMYSACVHPDGGCEWLICKTMESAMRTSEYYNLECPIDPCEFGCVMWTSRTRREPGEDHDGYVDPTFSSFECMISDWKWLLDHLGYDLEVHKRDA